MEIKIWTPSLIRRSFKSCPRVWVPRNDTQSGRNHGLKGTPQGTYALKREKSSPEKHGLLTNSDSFC